MIAVTPELLASWPIPPVAERTDKEARGRVMVVGGGARVAGATLLAGVAALRVGAGKLRIAAPASLTASLAIAVCAYSAASCVAGARYLLNSPSRYSRRIDVASLTARRQFACCSGLAANFIPGRSTSALPSITGGSV